MSVVTYTFIVFLLCTIVLYYIVPKKIQWVILLLASLVFYGYAGIEYLFLVIATAVVVYLLSSAASDVYKRQSRRSWQRMRTEEPHERSRLLRRRRERSSLCGHLS